MNWEIEVKEAKIKVKKNVKNKVERGTIMFSLGTHCVLSLMLLNKMHDKWRTALSAFIKGKVNIQSYAI